MNCRLYDPHPKMPPEPQLTELPLIEMDDLDTEIPPNVDEIDGIYFSNREKVCDYVFSVISAIFMDTTFDDWSERHITNVRYFLYMADSAAYISNDFSGDLRELKLALDEFDLFLRQTCGVIGNYSEKRYLNRALTALFDLAESLYHEFQNSVALEI